MFHGTDDNTVPLRVAEMFEEMYPNVDAYYYDDVDHAFERRSRKFQAYNEAAAKDAWRKTLEFLKEHSE